MTCRFNLHTLVRYDVDCDKWYDHFKWSDVVIVFRWCCCCYCCWRLYREHVFFPGYLCWNISKYVCMCVFVYQGYDDKWWSILFSPAMIGVLFSLFTNKIYSLKESNRILEKMWSFLSVYCHSDHIKSPIWINLCWKLSSIEDNWWNFDWFVVVSCLWYYRTIIKVAKSFFYPTSEETSFNRI